MFGLSFGELMVLIVVGIVVIGPKDLPKILRKLGQWSGKMRRMASDLRTQSGIDDVLREGSLSEDLAEIRKLARGELDHVVSASTLSVRPTTGPGSAYDEVEQSIAREREYPREGADGYGALPDTAIVYADLPASSLAEDPLYARGDAGPAPAKTADSPMDAS